MVPKVSLPTLMTLISILPEHNNGDGRRQQRDGGGLNDHPGLQDRLGLLDQRVLSLPSLTYPSGI